MGTENFSPPKIDKFVKNQVFNRLIGKLARMFVETPFRYIPKFGKDRLRFVEVSYFYIYLHVKN